MLNRPYIYFKSALLKLEDHETIYYIRNFCFDSEFHYHTPVIFTGSRRLGKKSQTFYTILEQTQNSGRKETFIRTHLWQHQSLLLVDKPIDCFIYIILKAALFRSGKMEQIN